jgi:hypothetical protein
LLSWKALLLWCRSWSGDTGGDTGFSVVILGAVRAPCCLLYKRVQTLHPLCFLPDTNFSAQNAYLLVHTLSILFESAFSNRISSKQPLQVYTKFPKSQQTVATRLFTSNNTRTHHSFLQGMSLLFLFLTRRVPATACIYVSMVGVQPITASRGVLDKALTDDAASVSETISPLHCAGSFADLSDYR